jgi:hypothetical protein
MPFYHPNSCGPRRVGPQLFWVRPYSGHAVVWVAQTVRGPGVNSYTQVTATIMALLCVVVGVGSL